MKIFDKKTLIGFVFGIVLIFLILKNMDINKSVEALKQINFFYILLMVPAYFCAFVFRAVRWKNLILDKKEIRLSSFLSSLFKGWLVNNIIPARGGELYRAHHFGKKENISRATILASIILERVFDGLLLFLILFLLTTFVYSSKKFFGVAVIAGIVFIGVFSGLLLISKFYKNTFIQEKFNVLILKIKEKNFIKKFLNEKICEFLSKIFNKITSKVISFMNGLELFNSPLLILKAFAYTFPVWICEGLSLMFLIKGFGYYIGILGSLFVLSIIAFISLIPGGPAGLGPVQWGYILSLGFFNVPRETAFAVSLVGQAVSLILISCSCLFFILFERINFKENQNINTEN